MYNYNSHASVSNVYDRRMQQKTIEAFEVRASEFTENRLYIEVKACK